MRVNPTQLVRIQDRKKLVVVAVSIFILFGILLVQFFKIQVLEGEKWAQKARAQHQIIVSEAFKRGVFYSNGHLSKIHNDPSEALVVDLPMFHLYLDPDAIIVQAKEKMIEILPSFIDCEKEKIEEEIFKKSRSRKIAAWISHEKKEEIEKWWYPFAKSERLPHNALYFVQDFKRCYPYGKLLGQVLQTVREEKNAQTHQAIPTGGLEYYFDKYLQGKEGKRRLLRSPKFPLDRGDIIEPPYDGCDIYLTIHHHVQAIVEEEIEKGVLAAKAKAGWAAVMDADTGDMLAIAQYPFFYPADYKSYYSDAAKMECTKVKAITDCFEPGSIIKPISFAIALKANKERALYGHKLIFDPEQKVDLRKIPLPGRKNPMKDIVKSTYLNMNMALQKSSNIYAADIIQKVVAQFGESWYRKQLQEIFGLGVKTDIELPSESAGFLPTYGKHYSNGRPQWSVPTPGCLAIGYNLLVNTIQVLRAYAVLGNGGYKVQPSLIKKIVNHSTQEVIYERDPLTERELVLDIDIIDRVIEGMKYVTKPGGTAFRGDIPGFTEVGKTSTSEKIEKGVYAKDKNTAVFAGFTPAKGAKLVILVAIDEPCSSPAPGITGMQFGGKCAAPVFKAIGSRCLQYLGEMPDDPYGYQKTDPRYKPGKADMSVEVKSLQQLFEAWNR